MSQLTAQDLAGIGPERLLATTLAERPGRVILKVSVDKRGNERLLDDLPKRERNEEAIEARHQGEMEGRGLAPVRDKADSGTRVIENAKDVSITPAVVTALETLGLVVSDFFWFELGDKPGKAYIRIVFDQRERCEGKVVEVGDFGWNALQWLLTKAVYRFAHVWVNLVTDKVTGEVSRSDSWNLNVPLRGGERNDLALVERNGNWVYDLALVLAPKR